MKKLFLVLMMLMLVFPLSTQAQEIKPVIYAGGGLSLPVTPGQFEDVAPLDIGIRDFYKTGYNLGGGFGIQVSPMIELIAKVNYNSFSFDDEGLAKAFVEEFNKLIPVPGLVLDIDVDGGTLTLLEIMGDIKFLIPVGEGDAPFRPFLLAGFGATRATITDADMTIRATYQSQSDTTSLTLEGETETKFGFNVGAGFDLMVSPMVGFYVEGRFGWVATSGDPIGYLPIRGGIKIRLQ